MPRLSVNVNKLATLRNARGGNKPDVVACSRDILAFGAEGLTIHPRPDERHIRESDIASLHTLCQEANKELNIEGYPDKRLLRLIDMHRPAQVTLVPDAPNTLTSNAGWQVQAHKSFLDKQCRILKGMGARVSLFVAPEPATVAQAADVGIDSIELYTGPYAEAYATSNTTYDPMQAPLPAYVETAQCAKDLNLGVHAGHDLDLGNLGMLVKTIPYLAEVSIGHSLICEALYEGFQNIIGSYLACIARAKREAMLPS